MLLLWHNLPWDGQNNLCVSGTSGNVGTGVEEDRGLSVVKRFYFFKLFQTLQQSEHNSRVFPGVLVTLTDQPLLVI